MDEEADRPIPPVVVPAAAAAQPVLAVAVTSCEEEEDDNESSDDDLALPPTARAYSAAVPEDNNDLHFFNDQADEEDEAYVYKHLRSGVEEAVTVVRRTSNLSEPPQQQQTVKMLKPRNSDAVLSCPCCFTIVCMDCQQHERYENQYRAMFVQNIAVRWDLTLQYDSQARMLVATTAEAAAGASSDISRSSGTHGETKEGLTDNTGTTTTTTKVDDDEDGQAETQTVYYTVCCANCQTQVAVLDMTEEVYHFSNCLVSSP